MADQKISELTALTGANLADVDAFAVVDTSAVQTKKITYAELKTALDTGTGFVRITGDTMTGALVVNSTITADYLAIGTTSDSYSQILINSSSTGESELRMGDTDTDAGSVSYTNSNDTMTFRAAAGARMALNSTGLDVTGAVTSDGLTVDGTPVRFNSTAPMLYFMETGVTDSNHRIRQNAGNLYFQKLSGDEATATTRMVIDGGAGDISFYEDTGTTAKFFWDASAERLFLSGSDYQFGIGQGSNQPWYSRAVSDGSFRLHLNGTGDVITADNTGIDVTGTVTADGLTVDGDVTINSTFPRIFFYESDTTNLNSTLKVQGGSLLFQSLNDDGTGTTSHMAINNSTGDISFYEDTGTTAKFHWDAADERLGIGTTSPAAPLDVRTTHTVTDVTSANTNSTIAIGNTGAGNGVYNAIKFAANQQDMYIMSFNNSAQASRRIGFFLGSVAGDAVADERLSILGNGNVGIGTASPAEKLHVEGSSPSIKIKANNEGGSAELKLQSDQGDDNQDLWSIKADPAHALDFINYVSGAWNTRMRIDSSGNVLVGTTDDQPFNNSAGSTADNGLALKDNGQLQVAAYKDTANTGSVVYFNRTSTDGDIIDFRKDGGAVGSIGVRVSDNLYINSPHNGIEFTNGDIRPIDGNGDRTNGVSDIGDADNRFKDLYLAGVGHINGEVNVLTAGTMIQHDYLNSGTYVQEVRGDDRLLTLASKSNDSNAGIVFEIHSNEKARFDNSGNLLVGRDSVGNTGNGHTIRGGDSAIFSRDASGETMQVCRNASAGDIVRFLSNGNDKGSIDFDGSNTISYTSSSDQRLKENIADADDAGSKIDAIKVRKYDWKADGSHQDYGMIAQELQTVAPEAVSGDADSEKMMGVDYSKLVPMLIKEIQSLRARITTLEG